MIWFVLFVVIAGIVAAPFVIEHRLPKIGKSARTGVPGQYARLSQGVTYYRWYGPTRGPVVVAVHGLTTPSLVWDVIAKGLGRIGYRVLVYDLFGRGLSDAPKGRQDASYFLQQLDDLLKDQGLSEDITFMGYSMGGAIVTAYAATNPHMVARVILIASSGLVTHESLFSKVCRLSGPLGDWLFLLLGRMRMRKALLRDPVESEVDGILEDQSNQLKRQGFLPSVLSSRRGILEVVQGAEHRLISKSGIDVIAIWGEADNVIPLAAVGQLAQWNRLAKQEVVAGADHALPYSHGSKVVENLRGVLAERPAD